MTLIKRNELTQVERDLLAYWDRCEKEMKGKPVSLTKVSKELRYKSSSGVFYVLKRLVRKGYMQTRQVKGRNGNVYSVSTDKLMKG